MRAVVGPRGVFEGCGVVEGMRNSGGVKSGGEAGESRVGSLLYHVIYFVPEIDKLPRPIPSSQQVEPQLS